MKNTYEMDFIQAIKEAGLEPPDKIVVDGQFNRFSSEGRPSDKSGWYVLNDLPHCAIAGAFGCWRTGIKQSWSSVKMSTLSKEKQRQAKKAINDSIQKAKDERKVSEEKTFNKFYSDDYEKRMLYTAITRAKKQLLVITNKEEDF